MGTERPISAGSPDPRTGLLRAATSEAAQSQAKGRCLGLPSGLCARALWALGKLLPSMGLSLLICERSCLGSTTLWTWVPREPEDQDHPGLLFSVASAPAPGSSPKIFKET